MIIDEAELLHGHALPAGGRNVHRDAAHAATFLTQRDRLIRTPKARWYLLKKFRSPITQHSTGAHGVFQDAIH